MVEFLPEAGVGEVRAAIEEECRDAIGGSFPSASSLDTVQPALTLLTQISRNGWKKRQQTMIRKGKGKNGEKRGRTKWGWFRESS